MTRRKSRVGKLGTVRLGKKDLEALRTDALREANFRCKKCSKRVRDDVPDWHPDKADLSHKRNRRMWGDTKENTEILCHACHMQSHQYGPSQQKPCPASGKVLHVTRSEVGSMER